MPDHPEDDPTGVRRLLSDLPDPTPPSADLIERIARSLDQFEDDPQAPLRFDASTSRQRARRPLLAGVLLLGLALVAVGAALAPRFSPRLHQAQAALHVATAPTDARTGPPASAPTGASSPTASGASVDTVVVSSGTPYHRGALTDQVDRLLTAQGAGGATTPSGVSHSLPGGLTVQAVHTCLSALAGHGRTLVDVATFGSHPALIVVREDVDTTTVTVLPPTCAHDGTTTPLAGPYLLH